MKELSIEEKAKAYDETIEKLRNFYRDYDTVSRLIDVKEELANLIPELKESEDERIRKSVSAYFATFKPNDMWDANFSFGDIVAWLEKQGNNNMGISEATKKKLEDNLNKALQKETPESWNEFLEKQGKQKPWSKEDESVLDALIRRLEGEDVYVSPHLAAERLRTLKDRVGREANCTTTNEWSERDKEEFHIAIETLAEAGQYDSAHWLQFLKERYTWKPSDEQMEALDDFIYAKYPNTEKHGAAVKSLYQDLKKLKGE